MSKMRLTSVFALLMLTAKAIPGHTLICMVLLHLINGSHQQEVDLVHNSAVTDIDKVKNSADQGMAR
jgi:hypothetical protein